MVTEEPTKLLYKRVLLKISGEALMGQREFGLDPATINRVAEEVKQVHGLGVECCLVIGGGNICRGLAGASQGMQRASADYVGMLATVMNALAMQNALEQIGVHTRVQSAISMQAIAEPYIRRRAIRHFEKGRVVIFAGGTGNPFFTTDTTAALRAVEVEAGAVLKGTQVDGVYTADPKLDPDATKLDQITYMDVLQRDLRVMDHTATTLCMENRLPIVVFDLMKAGNVRSLLDGQAIGTLVC